MICYPCGHRFEKYAHFVRHATHVHGISRPKLEQAMADTDDEDVALLIRVDGKMRLVIQPRLRLDASYRAVDGRRLA